MVVASAIIIIISSSIHNGDSKHFIITMISNLIEYSITEIVALYKFKTQFDSNFHPKNVCVDYHRRSDVRQVPRIFLFVVNSLISIKCVCIAEKRAFFRGIYTSFHIYTNRTNARERQTTAASPKQNHGSTCHFGTFSKFLSVRVCWCVCVCY